jgi:oleandomycin transport system permease protein
VTVTRAAPTLPAVAGRHPRPLRHTGIMLRRNLLSLRAEPLQVLDVAIMPMVLAVVFLVVFGGVLGGGGDYRAWLLPGMIVETVAFAARATGVGLNVDFGTGIMDRFRALPVSRASVLAGRIAADACRMALGATLVLVFALVIGFRIRTGPLAVLAAFAVLLAFGTALSWVTAFIGISVRSPQAVDTAGFLWIIPLQFGSSMFVDPATMPGWLRAVAAVNPISLACDAVRALLNGGPALAPVLGTLGWTVALTAVFAPLAVRAYARRT